MKKQLLFITILSIYSGYMFSNFLGNAVRAPFEVAEDAVGFAGNVASAPFGQSRLGNVVRAPFNATEDVLDASEDIAAAPIESLEGSYYY